MSETPPTREKTRTVVKDGERTRLRRAHLLALAAITLVGAVVRAIGLGDWSLWVDEAHTWRDATMPLRGDNGFLATDRILYPLTFVLLRALIDAGLAGEDPSSLRLPFAVVGALTVPLVAWAGRRLIGAWPAVLAAAILALHPWHVYWSQNARGYVVVVFAAVLVAERAFAYVRAPSLWRLALVWAGIGVAAASHPSGAFLAVAFVAFLVLRARPLTRGRVAALVVVGVLLAAGLPWLVDHSPFQGFLRSKSTPSLAHFVQTSAYYFRPLALLLAVGALPLLHRFAGRDRSLLLGSFFLAPFVALLVLGNWRVLATARYAIVALPIVVWLAAFACAHLGAAARRGWRARGLAPWLAAAALPACVLGEQAFALVDYATIQHGQRARWSEAAAHVRQLAAGRPVRVATINFPTLAYYLRRGMWRGVVDVADLQNEVVQIEDWMVAEGRDQFKQRVAEPGAANHLAWHRRCAEEKGAFFAAVVTLPELAEKDRDGAMLAAIRAECELALHLPCWVGPKDESIYVYVWKQP